MADPIVAEPMATPAPNRSIVPFIAVAIVLATALIALVLYELYLMKQSMWGFWHVNDNVYMLIDIDILRFIEIDGGTHRVLYETADFQVSRESWLPFSQCSFSISKPNIRFEIPGISVNPFHHSAVPFVLYPYTGLMCVMDHSGAEVLRLTKDNVMSNAYLQ